MEGLILHYKVVNRRLYLHKHSLDLQHWSEHGEHRDSMRVVRTHLEEIITVALYLFPVPDVEFVFKFGDDCPEAEPYMALNICIHRENAGFAVPEPAIWGRSMGPTQMEFWHSCLAERYPPDNRIPKAVWRGTPTFWSYLIPQSVWISKQYYRRVPRVHLAILALNHTDILDARLTSMGDKIHPDFKHVVNQTLGPYMDMEDWNKYCVVLDLDGNSWSARLVHTFVHSPTPVLKAYSNFTGALEHFFPPGVAIRNFEPNLSDLLDVVREMIEDCKLGSRSKGQQMVRNMKATSRHVLDHVAVAEAMAYIMHVYRNLTSWEVSPDVGEFERVNMTCCAHTKVPPKFAEAVTAHFLT